ncbi:hypothetical protein DEU56DRAFT_761560 [Suillus clintonianus]|uniref:uncharacterized protein n=1 Tax=Suillus clintonianus TaxID=1904413 RepID=UPI001B86413F|nr:uncharacterized protein DEU56DRAFT_761560 [Suillus clintonianus]KAG2116289.1 hypothetical protein DEU56DRAFT_761560 [Suillus clintonianus]
MSSKFSLSLTLLVDTAEGGSGKGMKKRCPCRLPSRTICITSGSELNSYKISGPTAGEASCLAVTLSQSDHPSYHTSYHTNWLLQLRTVELVRDMHQLFKPHVWANNYPLCQPHIKPAKLKLAPGSRKPVKFESDNNEHNLTTITSDEFDAIPDPSSSKVSSSKQKAIYLLADVKVTPRPPKSAPATPPKNPSSAAEDNADDLDGFHDI